MGDLMRLPPQSPRCRPIGDYNPVRDPWARTFRAADRAPTLRQDVWLTCACRYGRVIRPPWHKNGGCTKNRAAADPTWGVICHSGGASTEAWRVLYGHSGAPAPLRPFALLSRSTLTEPCRASRPGRDAHCGVLLWRFGSTISGSAGSCWRVGRSNRVLSWNTRIVLNFLKWFPSGTQVHFHVE